MFVDSVTIDEPEVEGASDSAEVAREETLPDKFSSKSRENVKRRASADSVFDEPPKKKQRRQSLQDLNDCAAVDRETLLKGVKPVEEKSEAPIESSCPPTSSEPPCEKAKDDVDMTIVSLSSPKSDSMCIDLDEDEVPAPATSSEPKTDVDEEKIDEEKIDDLPRSAGIISGGALDALFNGKKEITIKRKVDNL